MSSSRHPPPPSSSKSHPSDDGQPGPSREPAIPFRAPSSGSSNSSSSAKSHDTEVGKLGPSQAHKTSTHSPTSLKSHSSQTSNARSTLEPALGLGPLKRYNAISRVPLKWEPLLKSKRAEKEAAIIPRANYYMEICCPPGVKRDDYEKALEETHGRMAYNEHQRRVPAEMPHQELREMFPHSESYAQNEAREREQQAVYNPDLATVNKNFTEVRGELVKSALRSELHAFIQTIQHHQRHEHRKCHKIVAFEAGTLSPPHKPEHHISKQYLNRHAVLLAIQGILEEDNASMGETIQIFLQDEKYTQLDIDVLKKYGMTVVDGSHGSRMGFTLIDRDTLVVDFGLPSSVFPLLAEIVRPVAFLRYAPLDKKHYRDIPINDFSLRHDGKEVLVPASCANPSTVTDEIFWGYQKIAMDLKGLKLGAADKEKKIPKKLTLDAYDGTTHIGKTPTLYVRTMYLPDDDFRCGWGPGYKHVGWQGTVTKPDFGLRREALDWKSLLGQSKATRYPEIIKRVNLLTYIHGLFLADSIGWLDCLATAKKAKRYSKVRSIEFTTPNLEKIIHMYPRPEKNVFGNFLISPRMMVDSSKQQNPDPTKVADDFDRHVQIFQKSNLCKRMKILAATLFHEHPVNKIVAFGLGNLHSIVWGGRDNTQALRNHNQHATLLAIRDVWKESHEGNFDIYVQDPLYLQEDMEILEKWGIKVVNSDLGFQIGACLLDAQTLVVDFVALWPVASVTFEITRPAGYLSYAPYDEITMEMFEEEAIYHYFMEPESGIEECDFPPTPKYKLQNIHCFPGSGVSDRKIAEQGFADYREESLDLEGLDMGGRVSRAEMLTSGRPLDGSINGIAPRKLKEKQTAGLGMKPNKLLRSLKDKASSTIPKKGTPSQKPREGSKPKEKSTEPPRGILSASGSHSTPQSHGASPYERPEAHMDGEDGLTYIGYQPTLYIRKTKLDRIISDSSH